jgi:cytochrome P450
MMTRTIETPEDIAFVQLADYDDIVAFLRHESATVEVHHGNEIVQNALGKTKHLVLVSIDGDLHLERRQLESQLFSVSQLTIYERETLSSLLDKIFSEFREGQGQEGLVEIDLVRFGLSALSRIATSIVGIDGIDTEEATSRLLDCVDAMVNAKTLQFSKGTDSEMKAIAEQGLQAQSQLAEEYVAPSVERRKKILEQLEAQGDNASSPRDLITLLLSHPRDDWDPNFITREVGTYLGASIRTSTRALCNATEELLTWLEIHPEDIERTRDVQFLHDAVEETLRLHPVLPLIYRRANAEIDLPSGRIVHGGDQVALNLGAANRDSGIFGANATEFDPRRKSISPRIRNYGLAFGGGPHSCIGKRLAIGVPGSQNTGSITTLLSRLFSAKIERDPGHSAQPNGASFYDEYSSYPVRLTNL